MRNYKGNMLLIELVIVILFFALSQVVIVQVFAHTEKKNQDTARLNQSMVFAENILERLCNDRNPDGMLIREGFVGNGSSTYTYTQIPGVEFSAYVSHFQQPSGELVNVELTARQGDAVMFSLPSVQYFAKEVRHE